MLHTHSILIMSSFAHITLQPWVEKRILTFLNRARTPDDFSLEHLAPSHPGAEREYGIGTVVARRILDRRTSLFRFSHLAQLEDIPGLGHDKIRDLIEALGVPASEAFRRSMYNGVIGENFIFGYDDTPVGSRQVLDELSANPYRLQQFVAERVIALCFERFNHQQTAQLAGRLARLAPVESHTEAYLARYPFAAWLFRISGDNWFSFDRALAEVDRYLQAYDNYEDRLELHLLRGFENHWTLVQPITTYDLPVVLNYPEQKVTLWWMQLND
ncbi:MAG: hypothetical protein SF053_18750 [Bacteroidia bacterium]|nr:hypothetical protein [Bacteroidia bacterium]